MFERPIADMADKDLYSDLSAIVWYKDDEEFNSSRSNQSPQYSRIQDFYKDETVFITGATGFLGTLLVEKLLRCCPQVDKLILLVRNKRGLSAEERVRELFNEEVFNTMRLSNPNYHEKVDIICGAVDEDNFGLTPDDIRLLTSRTSIIFHVAATVRFDEHIRTAYNINVKGTKTAISFSRNMPRLKSFIYVSTAYCHSDRSFIDEKFYPPTFSDDQLFTIISNASDEDIAILNLHLLEEKPNSYTLTKAAAEDLIREVAEDLPVCIFRPSIVFSTLREPLPLWVKGFHAHGAIGIAGGTGLMRVYLCNCALVQDLVPADLTINAMTSLPWYQSLCPEKKVYNYVSYNDNRVTLGHFLDVTMRTLQTGGESSSKCVRWPDVYYTSNVHVYYTLFYAFHIIPATVFSLIEKLTHRKPSVVKMYRKIFFLTKVMAKFCLTEWAFENKNSRELANALSEEDRVLFESSMSSFEWTPMFEVFPRTAHLYMLKEPITKKHYESRMIYIRWAEYVMWLCLKAIALYLFLSFLAYLINFYCFNIRETF